jgi:hypothetical protein
MTTVIDKGPPADASKEDLDRWKKESPDGKPIERSMEAADANHAVAADPKRYELVHHDFVIVYDLGPGQAMERKAAEALKATDPHRYSIKDPGHHEEKHDAKKEPVKASSPQHR